jgi:hypothetical protein
MPMVRKLSDNEVRDIENKGKGQRKLVEEEYDRYLADYEVGEYGEADLAPEENRLTVRNRLKAAAARRGVSLEFRRTSGDLLRFKVLSKDGAENRAPAADNGVFEDTTTRKNSVAVPSVVEAAPAAPPKRKGGRPKKNA